MFSNLGIAWLLSYISIASFSAAFITPALPQIQLYYGLQSGQVEWVVTAFLFGYVIGQLFYGPLANRWGRVFALRIGLVINLIGIILCISSFRGNSFWLICMGRFVSALGAAGGLACTFMFINEGLNETQRKTAMAYSILSFTFGIGLAVTLGGVISEYTNWTYCFLFLLVHGLVMLLGTSAFSETLKDPQTINLVSILTSYKQALASRTLILFSLVVGFCSLVGYCFSAAGPQIAQDILHLSAAKYGYWNLMNMVGMLAGGLWAKRLLTCLEATQVIFLGFTGCALGIFSLCMMVFWNSSEVAWFFLSTLSLYLFSGLLFASGSLMASSAIADKASGSAMMSFINMSTASLAVVAMGYLAENPMQAFIGILSGMWLLIVSLLLFEKFFREPRELAAEQNKQ